VAQLHLSRSCGSGASAARRCGGLGKGWLGLGLALLLASVAQGQSSDRERAQMLQLQQQMQRLQSDNAAMARERAQLQDQAKEADEAKKLVARRGQDLAKTQGALAAANKDAERLRGELEALREQTSATLEQWKKALQERDEALKVAAEDKRKRDQEIALLATRLKVQTGRGDTCEAKHTQALALGREVLDAYAGNRLRLCEPLTGIWKVREEDRIQAYRDRLYELRLDVPVPAAAGAAAAQQAGAVATPPASPPQ
jgi:chromosome segregation ATPase